MTCVFLLKSNGCGALRAALSKYKGIINSGTEVQQTVKGEGDGSFAISSVHSSVRCHSLRIRRHIPDCVIPPELYLELRLLLLGPTHVLPRTCRTALARI